MKQKYTFILLISLSISFLLISISAVRAAKPVAAFTWSGKCQNAPFTFTNLSTTGTNIEYLWKFGDASTSNLTSPSHSFPKTGSNTLYTVWLVVTDKSTGEKDSISSDVLAKETPKPVASANSPICEKEELALVADPIFQADWSWTGPNSFASSQQNPLIVDIAPGQRGKYIVTASVDGCGSESDTVDVTVIPLPVVKLGKDTTVCSGKPLTLTAPAGYDRYLWNDMLLSQTFIPEHSGEYWVEVMYKGCRSWDTIKIAYYETPEIRLYQKKITVCENKSTLLGVNVILGTYYQWQGPNGFSAVGYEVLMKDLKPSMTGKYVVHADNHGCLAAPDTVYLTVNPLPVVYIGKDTTVCSDKLFTINAPAGFDTYKWQNGSTLLTFTPKSTGQYWLEVSKLGCYTKDTIQVTVNTKPYLNLGADRIFCEGKSTLLDPIDVFETYLWQDGSTGATFNATSGGIYWLETSIKNCFSRDTIRLTMQATPKVDLGKDTSLCYPNTVVWNLSGDYGSILWEDGSTSRSHEADMTGTYIVEVGKNKCYFADTIQVTLNSIPPVYLGRDFSICEKSTKKIGSTAKADTYLWSNGSTDSSLVVSQPGEYWLKVTKDGCTNADTIQIKQVPLPVIKLGNDTTLCANATLMVKPKGEFDTFLWQNGSRYNFQEITKPGVYWAEVMKLECKNRDTINVSYFPRISLNIGKDTAFCQGGKFTIEAPSGYKSYRWNDGSVTRAIQVDRTGNYIVEVELANGCTTTDTLKVTVWPNPVIMRIDTVHLHQLGIVVSSGTPPYQYSLNGGDFQGERVFYDLASGFYDILVTDANNCISPITRAQVSAEKIRYANFFTPNSDGYNDKWIIEGLQEYPTAIVKIFDRNGRLILKYQGDNFEWDGTFNGEPVPADTYWYMIFVKPEYDPITGYVTLKR